MLTADRITLAKNVLAAGLIALAFASAPSFAQGAARQDAVAQSFQDLFALSQKEKRGLTFYVRGQTIAGIVTKVVGNDAVEVRNQTHSRIIIRIDHVDALAIN